jgi:hypothetical protein
LSERRACSALSESRSSQRCQLREDEEDKQLTAEMLAVVGRYPLYGYQRFWGAKATAYGAVIPSSFAFRRTKGISKGISYAKK